MERREMIDDFKLFAKFLNSFNKYELYLELGYTRCIRSRILLTLNTSMLHFDRCLHCNEFIRN